MTKVLVAGASAAGLVERLNDAGFEVVQDSEFTLTSSGFEDAPCMENPEPDQPENPEPDQPKFLRRAKSSHKQNRRTSLKARK